MILSDLDNIVYNKFTNGEITLAEYIKYQNRDKMINYEEKYKEALGWMQSLYKGLHGITKEDAEHYFPELKESEDEKIRKSIIAILDNYIDDDNTIKPAIMNWLEKQGESTIINAEILFDIEIPFGANDSELQEVSYNIPEGFYAEIKDDRVVIKKVGSQGD